MPQLSRADIVAVLVFLGIGVLGVVCVLTGFQIGVIVSICALATGSIAVWLRRGRGAAFRRWRRSLSKRPADAVVSKVRRIGRPSSMEQPTAVSGEAPTLSIVMPVHNVAPYLESALLAVLYQEFEDFELIVVDDASTDASRAIMDMYAELDSRVRVLGLSHNSLGGAGIPSNMGVRAARGKYLGFVDSDDILMRDAFAKLVATAERDEADVVIGGFATFTDDERVLSAAYDLPRSLDVPRNAVVSATTHPQLLELSPVPWRKLYRMAFVRTFGIEYPEGDYFFEDNPLHWAVLSFADRVVLIDDVICHHRMGRDGQTMSSMEHRKGAFAHHLATALRTLLETTGERRDVLLAAFIDRLYGSRWVVRQQSHPGAKAMLAKRLAGLFDQAVAAGAHIPLAMRRTVESYRGSYPSHDLTVVLTAFNSGSKVKRTLDSLLAIRRIDCDIIVVDDGSTDQTLSILRGYESAHSGVHVFTQPHKGAGRARNSVIPLITGRFALFLDAGDQVDPQGVTDSVLTADRQELDLLLFRAGGGDVESGAGALQRISEPQVSPPEDAAREPAVAWNRIVRAATLHTGNIFFGASEPYEDILFHWWTVARAGRIGIVPGTVVVRSPHHQGTADLRHAEAQGDALHESLAFAQRQISVLDSFTHLKQPWDAFVTRLIAQARQTLAADAVGDFDARTATLNASWERANAESVAERSASVATLARRHDS